MTKSDCDDKVIKIELITLRYHSESQMVIFKRRKVLKEPMKSDKHKSICNILMKQLIIFIVNFNNNPDIIYI